MSNQHLARPIAFAAGTLLLTLSLAACAGNELPSEAKDASMGMPDAPAYSAANTNAPRKIAVLDDCLPTDAWPGGCSLVGGTVTLAQFNADRPRGHAAWRNQPSYMKISAGKNVKVANEGGRTHTLTKVAAYGAGIIAPLNWPNQTVAPECANSATRLASLLAPGEEMTLESMEVGIHKYMCCFHPWMTAEIRVH